MDLSNLSFVRTLRTHSSERYLIQSPDRADRAVLDLHFLADGGVAGTLAILDDALASEEQAGQLIEHVDEFLLPMANLDDRNLSFVVVHGKVLGTFSQAESLEPF